MATETTIAVLRALCLCGALTYTMRWLGAMLSFYIEAGMRGKAFEVQDLALLIPSVFWSVFWLLGNLQ